MAGLPLPPVPYTKTFNTIVNDYAAAAQSTANQPLDFTVGSVFLALAQATAGNIDWLQKLFLFALLVERLQTSKGQWVDTWTADFMPVVDGTNSPRLPASPAAGSVTFSRNAPQSQAILPVGTSVSTLDGTQVYQVLADTSNSAFNPTIIPGGGFVVPAGQTSINITVTALNPGTGGNVAANTITRIQSPVVGIDGVVNPAAFTTGIDPESDDALKARFKLFIQSLREATEDAFGFAITSLEQGLQYAIHENVDPNGATDYGSVVVYIDDGTGNPPTQTVQAAAVAVAGVRAAGVRPQVISAVPLNINIEMTVTIDATFNNTAILGGVSNAINAYVNSLGLENTLHFTELMFVAYNSSPGVINVTQVTVNGGTSDITPGMGQTIKVGSLTVNEA